MANNRKVIVLQLRDEETNHIEFSGTFKITVEDLTKDILKNIIEATAPFSTFSVDYLEFPLEINGVKIQHKQQNDLNTTKTDTK